MNLAIMQPYLFPYLGYYQLIAAVEKFVFYDDVNFIKNGWINRNRLDLAGAVRYFTVPLSGASSFASIASVKTQPRDAWVHKILDSIRHSYSRAPQFAAVFELVQSVLAVQTSLIADYAKQSVVSVAGYLGLSTEFVWTSSIYGNDQLRAAERVLDICRREGATHYWNLPGGRALYDSKAFLEIGVQLHFLEPRLPAYGRGRGPFYPGLSILDVLMWNAPEAVRAMMNEAERQG